MSNSSIWPRHGTLLGATTPGQNEPKSDCNKGVLRIPQSSSITGTSPSDCLVPDLGYSLEMGSYTSVEKQSVYSAAPADWATSAEYHQLKLVWKTGKEYIHNNIF